MRSLIESNKTVEGIIWEMTIRDRLLNSLVVDISKNFKKFMANNMPSTPTADSLEALAMRFDFEDLIGQLISSWWKKGGLLKKEIEQQYGSPEELGGRKLSQLKKDVIQGVMEHLVSGKSPKEKRQFEPIISALNKKKRR